MDPYSGWMGFINSLKNLAAAVGEGPMGATIKGLNGITDAINRMQSVWRDGGALGKAEVGGGIMAGGYGAYKLIAGVYALATAGPALNASAIALDGAAAALVEAAGVEAAGGLAGGKNGPKGGLLGWGIYGAMVGGIDSLFRPGAGLTGAPRWHFGVDDLLRNIIAKSGAGQGAGTPTSVLDAQRGGAGSNPLQSAIDHASALGGALNVKAKPMVDVSSIEAAIGKANQLVSILGVAQSAARASTNFDLPSTTGAGSVGREMNRNLADHGVVP
jgi:hypothetical protein